MSLVGCYVASDMRIAGKLWDDVFVYADDHLTPGTDAQFDKSEPLVSKTQKKNRKKKLVQKSIGYNTRSKTNYISVSFLLTFCLLVLVPRLECFRRLGYDLHIIVSFISFLHRVLV